MYDAQFYGVQKTDEDVRRAGKENLDKKEENI